MVLITLLLWQIILEIHRSAISLVETTIFLIWRTSRFPVHLCTSIAAPLVHSPHWKPSDLSDRRETLQWLLSAFQIESKCFGMVLILDHCSTPHWHFLIKRNDHVPPFFFPFFFLGLQLQHMEVPRLEVKLELQLPAYTTATVMQDLSCIGNLHHCSKQRQILNPLSGARDRTRVLMDTSQIHFCCATTGTPNVPTFPEDIFLYCSLLPRTLNPLVIWFVVLPFSCLRDHFLSPQDQVGWLCVWLSEHCALCLS